MIQGVPSVCGLGWVDLNFECSTVCSILLGLMAQHPNQSQPNPGPRAGGPLGQPVDIIKQLGNTPDQQSISSGHQRRQLRGSSAEFLTFNLISFTVLHLRAEQILPHFANCARETSLETKEGCRHLLRVLQWMEVLGSLENAQINRTTAEKKRSWSYPSFSYLFQTLER